MSRADIKPLDSTVFIVVPAYNEAKVLGSVLDGLKPYCRNIVVVDDGSSDDTSAVALAGNATVVRHPINCGQGAALRTGLDFALSEGARVIVTFDSDGQHDPADLPALVAPVQRGECDVALGSRFLEGSNDVPAVRRFVLWGGIWFTRLVSGIRLTDTHNGFRVFSRHAAEVIKIHQNRMAHASEILDEIARRHLSFCEVPVHIRYNDYSMAKGQRSTASLKIAIDFLMQKLWH